MNLARISADGQITVPVEIRRLLKLKEGDKMFFMRKDNGEVVVNNSSLLALREAQNAFSGIAEESGSPNEEEIQSWVDEVRYGKAEKD